MMRKMTDEEFEAEEKRILDEYYAEEKRANPDSSGRTKTKKMKELYEKWANMYLGDGNMKKESKKKKKTEGKKSVWNDG